MTAYRWVYGYACVSLWAWWEVVAAHHWVHDYACCHLQADCVESGISSDPLCSITSMGTLYLYLLLNEIINIIHNMHCTRLVCHMPVSNLLTSSGIKRPVNLI